MIHLLWPTIRPTTFKRIHSEWMRKCDYPPQVITKVAVNTEEDAAELDDYNVMIVAPKHVGVVYPAYKLTSTLEADDNDIIVLASDDFHPPKGWDSYIADQFEDFDGCLFVRDGYQTPDPKDWPGTPAITIPIMTYSCLKKLNLAIYHPAYRHMASDVELYLNVKELGMLKDNRIKDKVTFEHHHYVTEKREMDHWDEKYEAHHSADRDLFEKRKEMSLERRLEIITK